MRGSGLGIRGPGKAKRRRWVRRLLRLTVVAAVLAAATFLVGLLLVPSPSRLLATAPAPSLEIVDRHGELLRRTAGADGVRYRPVRLGQVSRHLVSAVLAAEDRRFFRHPGIDPLAVARAAWQNLRAGRVVSGASTLTMQLARLLDPRSRSWRGKVAQALLALRLELALSKREILAAYLSRVPMGNRVMGFETASRVYLGKPAAQLSPAEAALLVTVPRSPSRSNPWRGQDALLQGRDAVLRRMGRCGLLEGVTQRAALAEPVVLASAPLRHPAPHFTRRVLAEVSPPSGDAVRLQGTIDLALQRRVEAIVGRHLEDLAANGIQNMAVVVLDVERSEWLALEGSGGFWALPAGQLDGSRAPRQPGSALKPFTYVAAFDRGLSPAAVLADLPRTFTWSTGTWVPRNYDDAFHGPLRARAALACSVNVPAVAVLQQVGPAALLELLERAGITTLGRGGEHYGLGLTLGAGEVRLDELTAAYAALLRGGEWRATTSWKAARDGSGKLLARPPAVHPRRVCSPEAAAQVVDILADPLARAGAFGRHSVLELPFAAAVKTGTSEGFRDNWCIGGTREVAVGVWCGSFDRSPMGNVSGVAGAGAVWREVMLASSELAHGKEGPDPRYTLKEPPSSLTQLRVCALSGLLPGPHCPATVRELLGPAQVPRETCDWHGVDTAGRPVVRWPPRFRDWAVREGLLAAHELRQGEGGALAGGTSPQPSSAGAVLAVTTPADGDAFVLAPDLPRRYQTLQLRCTVHGTPADVRWLVDGREHARVGPPYSSAWSLRPGSHRIQVAAEPFISPPVAISVFGE